MPYDIGFAAHGLAVLVINKYDTASKLDPLIRELARTLNETVHIGALDGDKVVHVARALPDEGPNLAIRIGARENAHVTALGKAMLAALPRQALERLFPDEQLPARGPHALQTRSELFRELEGIPARGFAFSKEESRAGVSCIAAPLFGSDGHPLLAISVTTTPGRLEGERQREVATAVMAAAAFATASFGGRAPETWAQRTDGSSDLTSSPAHSTL
jgi:DNA-binding IclR family transcriptional regulator